MVCWFISPYFHMTNVISSRGRKQWNTKRRMVQDRKKASCSISLWLNCLVPLIEQWRQQKHMCCITLWMRHQVLLCSYVRKYSVYDIRRQHLWANWMRTGRIISHKIEAVGFFLYLSWRWATSTMCGTLGATLDRLDPNPSFPHWNTENWKWLTI